MSSIQKWTVSKVSTGLPQSGVSDEDSEILTGLQPYLEVSGTLLEGPFYDRSRNEFRFVDIWEQKLYALDLAQGPKSLRTLDTSYSIGVTANIASGSRNHEDYIVAAAKHGFALVHRGTGEINYLARPWSEKDKLFKMRFNDGAVDSRGRLWAGAMNDPKVEAPINEGVLFRLDSDLKLNRVLEHLTIPNGIGWNLANDTMYLTDSPTGKIFAFDFNEDTGEISNRRVHFDIGEPKEPDGFAIDTEGCIWSAIYGGGKVIRISPHGEVIGEISLPTRNITCPVFVGTELFITTAKDDTNDDQFPESIRYGGNLYKIDVGIEGQPRHEFRMNQ